MKPILFNTEMVRAILGDRKTATRRVVKPQPDITPIPTFGGSYRVSMKENVFVKPPYRPGDILYVRETWTKLWYVDPGGYTHFDQPMYYYAADGTPDITLYDEDGFEQDDQRIRWHPSIHMPREAARIFLRVTDVRVEKLRSITEEQAEKEGGTPAFGYNTPEGPVIVSDEDGYYVIGFKGVWDSTIKPADRALYGWEANPYVWVIEFERC